MQNSFRKVPGMNMPGTKSVRGRTLGTVPSPTINANNKSNNRRRRINRLRTNINKTEEEIESNDILNLDDIDVEDYLNNLPNSTRSNIDRIHNISSNRSNINRSNVGNKSRNNKSNIGRNNSSNRFNINENNTTSNNSNINRSNVSNKSRNNKSNTSNNVGRNKSNKSNIGSRSNKDLFMGSPKSPSIRIGSKRIDREQINSIRLSDNNIRSRNSRSSNDSNSTISLMEVSNRRIYEDNLEELDDMSVDTDYSYDEVDATIDTLEAEMKQKFVKRVYVKLVKELDFRKFRKYPKTLYRLWNEIRIKYYNLYSQAKNIGIEPIMMESLNKDPTKMNVDELIYALDGMYIAYSDLRNIVNNEFQYMMIKVGISLFYKLVCWIIDKYWDLGTKPILNVILSNMDVHDALIRQMKFGDGDDSSWSITSIPIGIRIMGFVAINLIIILVAAKLNNIGGMLNFIASPANLAQGASNLAGNYAATGNVEFTDCLGDMMTLFNMFSGNNNQQQPNNNQQNQQFKQQPANQYADINIDDIPEE